MRVFSVSSAVAVVVSLLCLVVNQSSAAPNPGFFEKLFGLSSYHGGSSGGYNNGYYSGGSGYSGDYRGGYSGGYSGGNSGSRRQKQGRSYSDICRVVTIDAYARPGGRVFPAAPFCPYKN